MSKFKGSNSDRSAMNAFYRRVKYSALAFDQLSDMLDSSVFDFNFSHNCLYAKVDIKYRPIIPNELLLKSYGFGRKGETNTTTFPIIGDKVTNVMNVIQNNIMMGNINNPDSFLQMLTPVGSYVSPISQYKKYLNTMIEAFHETRALKNKNRITNFDNYLLHFYRYFESVSESFPCTLSGWYMSSKSSLLNTGMFVDLLPISFSEDAQKEIIVGSSDLSFYVNLLQQNGLLISRNSPNLVGLDIGSSITQKALQQYQIYSIDQMFRDYYIETSSLDLELLMNALVEGYNKMFEISPDYETKHFGKNNKIIINIKQKEIVNSIKDISIYIKYYINIRNIEQGKYLNKTEIDALGRVINFLQKDLDSNAIMRYINDELAKSNPNKIGSFSWFASLTED